MRKKAKAMCIVRDNYSNLSFMNGLNSLTSKLVHLRSSL